MLDKTKSYKFTGGKLVERTAEEQAELQRRKAEAAPPPRMPKSKEPFVKLTIPQLKSCLASGRERGVLIFMVMLHENFRHRGKPFILPADKLAAHGGFKPPDPTPGTAPTGGVRPDLGEAEAPEAAGDHRSIAPTRQPIAE